MLSNEILAGSWSVEPASLAFADCSGLFAILWLCCIHEQVEEKAGEVTLKCEGPIDACSEITNKCALPQAGTGETEIYPFCNDNCRARTSRALQSRVPSQVTWGR